MTAFPDTWAKFLLLFVFSINITLNTLRSLDPGWDASPPTCTHLHFLAQMQPLLPMLDDLSAQWKTWREQFGSYLRATGLDKAPKEKQLAIFLQRLGKDRPRFLPSHTGNKVKTSSSILKEKESQITNSWTTDKQIHDVHTDAWDTGSCCCCCCCSMWKHHCGALFITLVITGSIDWAISL